MGTGWADAAGALSVAQDTGDLAGLLRARLLASKIAAAQANAQAMDATGSEKVGPALASAAQADFLARRKGMDPTEDRIAKRQEFEVNTDLAKKAALEKGREFDITSGLTGQERDTQAAAQAEAARHNRVGESQDWQRIKLEQAKNQGLSVGGDATAEAIAKYQVPPPSPRQLATPAGEALMQKVLTLNPAYRGEEFGARAQMRKAFTSGAQSKTLGNLNTAIEHLDQISGMADKLQNSTMVPWNAVTNYFSAAAGNPAVTNFNGMKTILAGELAGAFKQTGATDAEISSVKEAINASQSPQQLQEYITKTAIPALGAKASTFGDQYRDVMGEGSNWSPYTKSAKTVLQKYGVVPADEAPAPPAAAPAAKPSGIKSITLVTP